MPPATELSVEEVRVIIDHAHTAYMSSLPPVELPSEQSLQEGETLFAREEGA